MDKGKWEGLSAAKHGMYPSVLVLRQGDLPLLPRPSYATAALALHNKNFDLIAPVVS